jgi:head-tail adaptor
MILGKLDRKLKLFKQVFTTNEYGEREVTAHTLVTIYGNFNFKSGNTTFDADALINEERIECLIRYRTDIGTSPQYFISNGTTIYSIKSIKEIGRKDSMLLTLEQSDVIDLSGINTFFEYTINTNNTGTGSSTATQYGLPTRASGTYNFTVDWGDGSTNTITTYNDANGLHTYGSAGTYTIKIKGVFSGINTTIDTGAWNLGRIDTLKILDIKSYGPLIIQDSLAFKDCTNLTSSATDNLQFNTTDASGTFQDTNFNGVVNNWDVSNITNFSDFFHGSQFNQDCNNWNISKATSLSSMFESTPFNKSLSNWDTSSVTNLGSMFAINTAFNQDISIWNISNVTTVVGMFSGATAFDNSLASWDVTGLTGSQIQFFFNGSGLSTANYDDTLIGWAAQNVNSGVNINFGTSQYTAGGEAAAARATLVTKGWTITDGGTA